MLIHGLLGMYFDAAVVYVTKSSLLFRLALAILWIEIAIKSFFADDLMLWAIILLIATNFMPLKVSNVH